jgi:hypothetical protein
MASEISYFFAQASAAPDSWALIPYGGAGGDLEGMLVAGMNVVIIDRLDCMIDAIKIRIGKIQGMFEAEFGLMAWVERLLQTRSDEGGEGDEEDEDNKASE